MFGQRHVCVDRKLALNACILTLKLDRRRMSDIADIHLSVYHYGDVPIFSLSFSIDRLRDICFLHLPRFFYAFVSRRNTLIFLLVSLSDCGTSIVSDFNN